MHEKRDLGTAPPQRRERVDQRDRRFAVSLCTGTGQREEQLELEVAKLPRLPAPFAFRSCVRRGPRRRPNEPESKHAFMGRCVGEDAGAFTGDLRGSGFHGHGVLGQGGQLRFLEGAHGEEIGMGGSEVRGGGHRQGGVSGNGQRVTHAQRERKHRGCARAQAPMTPPTLQARFHRRGSISVATESRPLESRLDDRRHPRGPLCWTQRQPCSTYC